MLFSFEAETTVQSATSGLKDQVVWSLKECVHLFQESLNVLAEEFNSFCGDGGNLVWDKVSFVL